MFQARGRLAVTSLSWLKVTALGFSSAQPIPGPKRIPQKKLPIPGVDHVILVSSAKGGVGKSTVAVNLAVALSKQLGNGKVGLMDADIFGPSIPTMLGIEGIEPQVDRQKMMLPIENHGLKIMSIGSIVRHDAAVVWRGLLVMSAIRQLLRQVVWGPLDVLVVDMPPGTGDVQLSLSQNIPIDGAVIVTTPHKVAVTDTRRGIDMLLKVKVPLVGVVENMSHFVCPSCGKQTSVLRAAGAEGGGAALSVEYDTPLLASIPVEPEIAFAGDEGCPVIISNPESTTAAAYKQLATAVCSYIKRKATV